ncbi:hypothetical protein ACU4HD_35705 [Cupriavidus basilensis]
MREEIVTASVRLDETEALGVVEPFNDTGLHGIAFPGKNLKETDSSRVSEQSNSRKGHHGQRKYT